MSEIYENQRWIGTTWAPTLASFDYPAWSTPKGHNINKPHLHGWRVVLTTKTDVEGWQYATVFNHLDQGRPGGRASRRLWDMVRRRVWQRVTDASEDDLGELFRMDKQESVIETRRSYTACRSKAVKSFIAMWDDMFKRRDFAELLPWDPFAFFSLRGRHICEYNTLSNKAKEENAIVPMEALSGSILHNEGSLLQDLLCGAMHSRAAYGYAMHAGHMGSIFSFILPKLYFDSVGGASQDANDDAVAALAGVRVEDILYSNWNNSSFRPCFYVAADRANRCIVVSIRGTLQIGDVASDVTAHPIQLKLLGINGWVHQGIMSASTFIHCISKPHLEAAAKLFPGWPVLVTGHSLGGGAAAILAALLHDEGGVNGLGKVHCVTLGSPAVFCSSLSRRCSDFVTSIVLESDIVPRLGSVSVENLLSEIAQSSLAKKAIHQVANKVNSFFKTSGNVKRENLLPMIYNPDSWWNVVEHAFRVARQAAGLLTGSSGQQGSTIRQIQKIFFQIVASVAQNGTLFLWTSPYSCKSNDSKVSARELALEGKREITPAVSSGIRMYPPGKIFWILTKGDVALNGPWQVHGREHSNAGPSNVDHVWENALVDYWHETMDEDVLFVLFDGEKTKSIKEKNTQERKYVLTAAGHECFGRILLHPSMIDDHFPHNYLRALQEL